MFKTSKLWWQIAIVVALLIAACFQTDSVPLSSEIAPTSTPAASTAGRPNIAATPTATDARGNVETTAVALSLPIIEIPDTSHGDSATDSVSSGSLAITSTAPTTTNLAALGELSAHLESTVAVSGTVVLSGTGAISATDAISGLLAVLNIGNISHTNSISSTNVVSGTALFTDEAAAAGSTVNELDARGVYTFLIQLSNDLLITSTMEVSSSVTVTHTELVDAVDAGETDAHDSAAQRGAEEEAGNDEAIEQASDVKLPESVEPNVAVTYTADVTTQLAVSVEVPVPPVAPLPRPEPLADGAQRTVRLPILMYHYLSVPPADANIYRQDLSVSPALFAQHLDWMLAAGYSTVSMYDLYAHLASGAPLPEKPVILTFDDGYRDVYENAFPLLKERGMTATLFVVTDFMDEERPEYLSWDMAREMLAAGFSIESHGRNHVSLKNKDSDYLVWQALGSLETIQFELGVRPRFISYPAGEYDQQTIDLFKSANYWAGLTTIQGATHHSDDLFQLHRVRIRGTTQPEELVRLLELDW